MPRASDYIAVAAAGLAGLAYVRSRERSTGAASPEGMAPVASPTDGRSAYSEGAAPTDPRPLTDALSPARPYTAASIPVGGTGTDARAQAYSDKFGRVVDEALNYTPGVSWATVQLTTSEGTTGAALRFVFEGYSPNDRAAYWRMDRPGGPTVAIPWDRRPTDPARDGLPRNVISHELYPGDSLFNPGGLAALLLPLKAQFGLGALSAGAGSLWQRMTGVR